MISCLHLTHRCNTLVALIMILVEPVQILANIAAVLLQVVVNTAVEMMQVALHTAVELVQVAVLTADGLMRGLTLFNTTDTYSVLVLLWPVVSLPCYTLAEVCRLLWWLLQWWSVCWWSNTKGLSGGTTASSMSAVLMSLSKNANVIVLNSVKHGPSKLCVCVN